MAELKSHWGERAKEFQHPDVYTPQQGEECFAWVEAHGFRAGKVPVEGDILKLMYAADAEHAPKHVRHFLWALYHRPEEIGFFH